MTAKSKQEAAAVILCPLLSSVRTFVQHSITGSFKISLYDL